MAEARLAFKQDEVPIGAVIVQGDRIIGRAANQVELLKDATAHAELLAITQAFAACGEKRIPEAELFCTVEPCLMCAGAILHARIKRVVYATPDPKFGGVESLTKLFELPSLNHQVVACKGPLGTESGDLLREFFRMKRRDAKQRGIRREE